MKLEELNDLVMQLDKELPKKILDGKEVYDFKDAKIIPGVVCFVFYNGKLLIAKRSDKVSEFKEKWSVVAGHLDRPVPVQEIILEELREEVNIQENEVKTVDVLDIIEMPIKNTDKRRVVLLAKVHLKNVSEIKLNWENTDYAWVDMTELSKFELMPLLESILYKFKNEFE